VFVSAATIWELAVKQAIGKLKEPADLPELVRDSGLTPVPITVEHAVVAGRLPMIHRDPFDRMLVAQARCLDLTVLTRDPYIARYAVSVRRA
jgi:PIN domain nuclease of toxin-antitoxin system